ncbi:MAG: hypothetical protein IKE22_12900, partial [Atopobiaceae bacterium]|nr:hypothetical protein [Atopobiaceae bacterium]
MTDELRPSTTNDAVTEDGTPPSSEPTNAAVTEDGTPPSSEPTTFLPDPEESTFFELGPIGDLQLPEEDEPPTQHVLLTASAFSRERDQEESDALDSLDKTILRPHALFPQQPPAPRVEAPELQGSSTLNHRWRTIGIATAAAALILMAGAGLSAPRRSNVGLFGISKPVERVAQHDTNLPSEPVAPEADVEETEAENEGEDYVEWEPSTEEPEVTDENTQNEEDSYPDWVNWYSWPQSDETKTEDERNGWGAVTTNDDGVSYDFDGGNVTYHYDDGSISLDLDSLDELEQYLDTYDIWGYGSPGGEQGYGRGY